MKLLLLAPHPFYQVRGTPIDVDLLVRALVQRGVEVDIVTYHEGTDVDYPGVRIHRIRASRLLDGVRPGFSLRKLWCDLLLFQRAWGLVRRGGYDAVHADEEVVFFAIFFKWARGLPYVYDMDSSIAQQTVEKLAFLSPLRPLFDFLEGVAIRRAIAVAPVCNALGDLAVEHGADKVVVLHDISQLDDDDFAATQWSLREQVGVPGPLAVYVGNLERYQGIDLLLASLAHARKRCPGLHLVVAGGVPAHIEAYRRKADRAGVGSDTTWLGPWPNERLGELLAQADLLVAPRIRGLNTPMKIFPYLHSGRPVVATRLPTHTQLLDDSVALLADADPVAFGDAMARLADDRGLRERLGAAGRELVRRNHLYIHHRRRVDRLYDLVERALTVASEPAPAST